MIGTRDSGTSTPMSPRATMMPSLASRILSKFTMASSRSILEMIWVSRPWSSSTRLTSWTCFSSVTIDMATKSACCSAANLSPLIACGPRSGRDGTVPGVVTPRRSVILPPVTTRQRTFWPLTSVATSSTKPSSRSIRPPTTASRWIPGGETLITWRDPHPVLAGQRQDVPLTQLDGIWINGAGAVLGARHVHHYPDRDVHLPRDFSHHAYG